MNIGKGVAKLVVLLPLTLGTLMNLQYSAIAEKEATVRYATELGAYTLERTICADPAELGSARGSVEGAREAAVRDAVDGALEAADIGARQQGKRIDISVVDRGGAVVTQVKNGDTVCVRTRFSMPCAVVSTRICQSDGTLPLEALQCVVARGCDVKDGA